MFSHYRVTSVCRCAAFPNTLFHRGDVLSTAQVIEFMELTRDERREMGSYPILRSYELQPDGSKHIFIEVEEIETGDHDTLRADQSHDDEREDTGDEWKNA